MGLLRESSSRDKQRIILYTFIAVVFVFLYLIVFPRNLPAEFTLVPSRAVTLADTKAGQLTPGGSFFLLGGWEGYWNAQGDLERVQARRPQATVWGDREAWFDAAHDQVVVEGLGGMVANLPGEQYPYWSQGRLFTFDENRMGLRAFDSLGKPLWTKQFASMVTALDASANLTVVGTLDGKVRIFGAKGEQAGGFQPGGSRLPVVYNVGISPKGGSVLVLAGVDPKRFLVLERGGADYHPVFHKPLRETRPWPTPLGFLNSGSLAYYQTENGLAILDPKDPSRETLIPVQGSPLVLESLPGGRLVAFVERNGDQAALRVASLDGASLMTLPFGFQDTLLKLQGKALLLGVDQTLLRLEVKVQ